MLFGKPKDYSTKPETWFAWRPVFLDDDRIAWLQYVNRAWSEVVCFDMIGVPHKGRGWVYTA